ncbi:hypothetical protein MTP10_32165 [Nonomuraea sp. 3-1Str]|uniref:hypothetical protein n=1 Tax=Nonomuraea sp. 3-1Str TaxID=2929801 RepID=UPI0028658706|nr:hypothetical protein [Nonomuraea sp. 3-1Str]MDR8413376.1 hypothetical protein [Nonomuraea sp. 3-1Str]
MTQHQFPMFVTPHEAGASPAANGYSAYLLGHQSAGRTSAQHAPGEPAADTATDGPAEEGAPPPG